MFHMPACPSQTDKSRDREHALIIVMCINDLDARFIIKFKQ